MNLAVLACSGLDKPEGSVAREVAIRLAEEAGALIICPVVLSRVPSRYKKAMTASRLVVVDGCATQCAGKLAAVAAGRPVKKVIVSEVLTDLGRTIGSELRLDVDGVEVSQVIVDDVLAAAAANSKKSLGGEVTAATVEFESPLEFVVVAHEKHEFRIPKSGFLFNANDVWAQVVGLRARVGISDYMQQRLTDITYVSPPKVGTTVEQFGEVGSVESTKATFEVVSPVTGTVVRVNAAVEEMPESINEDPYGSWIAELELSSWEEDEVLLMDGPAYAMDVERKAAED